MLRHPINNTILVVGEHHADHHCAVAQFLWNQLPRKTHTLAVTPSLSIELSSDFVMRPLRMTLFDIGALESVEELTALAGVEFADNMLRLAATHQFKLRLRFNEAQRFYLAKLQSSHKETPATLRDGCLAFLSEHTHLFKPSIAA